MLRRLLCAVLGHDVRTVQATARGKRAQIKGCRRCYAIASVAPGTRRERRAQWRRKWRPT